jgi:hypothetical protein
MLSRRIDAAVAGKEAVAARFGDREALAVHADAFDDDGVGADVAAVAGEEAAVEPCCQRRRGQCAGQREHAAAYRPELARRLAVQQVAWAAAAASDRGNGDEQEREELQPVHPHRPTPP